MRKLMAVGAMLAISLALPSRVDASPVCSAWMSGDFARGHCYASTVPYGQRTRLRVTTPSGTFRYSSWVSPGATVELYVPGGRNPLMQVCC